MKKRRILKSLIMIFATVLSVLSGLIVDSKLTITAHAASNYGLTVKWTEGVEWVATDETGTDRWTNGGLKYFAENTSAGTYIKLKPGYRLDCLAADAEWSDYTALSDTLYYDSWSMYEDRTVTVKVISEVFEENGERYTYNGNYHEACYNLVEVDSWSCTHSFEDDDIIGYIESDPSDIAERKRLNPTNEKLLSSLRTYTSDSRYKIRVGSPYVKYTGEVPGVEGNDSVSKYTLYVDTHNVSNETGFYPEYGADKNNDWLLAGNYRCPDTRDGADADYAGYAYYRRYYAYCKDTQSWYIVGSAHNWLGCAAGDTGVKEFHTKEYTHIVHKYKLVESHEYTVRLNAGNIDESEWTKLTETASAEGWTWNESGKYFSKTFVQNENNYLPGVNKFFSAYNYESVGSKVTDKYFVQDKTKNPTKVLYNWWTSALGGTDIGRGNKMYNNLYEISKDNSGIVNLYPHWMGYTTVFNYTDNAPANAEDQTVTINNNINDGMDDRLYQVYGNCFFYKGTDGEYHDYEGTNPDLKVTASIPDNNGYKYIFNGWHHKKLNYLTNGLGKLTYKNNYNIGQGKTSYSLSPHFSRVGISYDVRLNANVPENTESTLQVLHQNGISSYIYNSTNRYFSRELTYDDSQDMLSPDVYSLKGYHLISRSNWYTEKTGGNTVSALCNNTEAEYPDWTENYWNLTTEDGATVDLYARWEANTYKISYNLDGGTHGESHPDSAKYDTTVTISNPTKTGYVFAGWTITGYDENTSGHTESAWTGETRTDYSNLTAEDGATVTFTAKWTKEAPKTANLQTIGDVGIKATSHPDKTVVNVGSSVQVSAVLNTGYVFKGWYNGNIKVSDDLSFDYTMPDVDTVLTAKTEIKWYTMTFDPNGGILKNPGDNLYNADWKNGNAVSVGWNMSSFSRMNGDLPTRQGYRFTGWYLGNESVYNKYGVAVRNSSLYSYDTDYHWRYDGNVTVKAGWDAINYKISYKVATGTGSIPSQTVHYGDSFTLADGNAFTYAGHTFSHWYVRRNSDKKVFCYDGVWHATDGSELYGSDISNWYPYNNSGLTFEMNDAWTRSDTDADEEFTFWGFWTADEYSITYNLNGGSLNGKTNPDKYTSETADFTLNNPTKNGYTFVGWRGTGITDVEKTVTITKGSTGNRTYEAVWIPTVYTITYNLDGGTVVGTNPDTYTIETDTFTLKNPVKIGYTFIGWTGSNGSMPSKNVSVYKGSTGNKTFTANYVKDITVKFVSIGHTNTSYMYDSSHDVIMTPGSNYTIPEESADWYKGRKIIIKYDNLGIGTKPDDYIGNMPFDYWEIQSGLTDETDGYFAGEDTIGQLKESGVFNAAFADMMLGWSWRDGQSDVQTRLPSITAKGYVFKGWYADKNFTEKAENVYAYGYGYNELDAPQQITLYAKWEATENLYTVNHYYMNLNGNYPETPDKTESFAAKTGDKVTPATIDKEGFTSPSRQTVTINTDGSTVVNYYYERNKYTLNLNGYLKQRSTETFADLTETVRDINGKDVKYTFATATIKINGEVVSTDVIDFNEKVYYGSTYEITTTAKPGYTVYDGIWIKNTVTENTVVMPKVSINQYTIKFEPNKPDENLIIPTKMADQSVYYNRERKLDKNTYSFKGFDFAGWNTKADGTGVSYTDEQVIKNLSSANNEIITLYAQWKPGDSIYTVKHYYMDVNGNYKSTPDVTDVLHAKTGDSITPATNDKEGFTSPSKQTVSVKYDGTTTVNYYYERNKYIIDLNGYINGVSRSDLIDVVNNPLTGEDEYHIAALATVSINGQKMTGGNNYHETGYTDLYMEVYYGSQINITPVAQEGYKLIGDSNISFTMPAKRQNITISLNSKTDVVYIVKHWKEKLYLDGTTTYADSSKHDTDNYFLADEEKRNDGTAYHFITPGTRSYEGFTSPEKQTVRIEADGSTVINYYYTRNTYTIETDDSYDDKDKENGIKSGNGIDEDKTKTISDDNGKTDAKKFKYEEIVTVTTDTLPGYHWHTNDNCYTWTEMHLYETGWSDEEDFKVEKWVTENGKTYGYKDQTTKFYMPAHDVKLRADATNNSYTLVFNKNKPVNVVNPDTGAISSASNEVTGTVAEAKYIYNHSGQRLNGVYNLKGWTFKGWSRTGTYYNNYDSSNKNKRYDLAFAYSNGSWNYLERIDQMTVKNLDRIILYAKWEANTDRITLNYAHDSSNPHGNLNYSEQAENDSKLTKNGPDAIRLTYDSKISDSPDLPSGLPVPTLTGARSNGWVDNEGRTYSSNSVYTGLTNNSLYITWQEKTGTLVYNANGITYNNNGVGSQIASKNDREDLNVMTDDVTLEDNMFGITSDKTTYDNYTQVNNFGYAILKEGTSYISIIDTEGRTNYYSFQGWSANMYATVEGSKNTELIHQPGYSNKLYRYVYETMAASKHSNENKSFSLSTTVADKINNTTNELIEGKGLGVSADQMNLNAVMYAVWDEFPVVDSTVVNISVTYLEKYLKNEDGIYSLDDAAKDEIRSEIRKHITVSDREDGNIIDNVEYDGIDDIIEAIMIMYKTPGKSFSKMTTRIHVTDSADNTTYSYIKVLLTSSKATQDEPTIPSLDPDTGKIKLSGIRSDRTRVINKMFYGASYENGGPIPNSAWKNNERFKAAIEQCFKNFEDNTPEETWFFTHDQIREFQSDFNPVKTTESLDEFYNKYIDCKIK